MNREQILERLRALQAERSELRDEFRTLAQAETLDDIQQSRFDELEEGTALDALDTEESTLKRKLAAFDRYEKIPDRSTESGDDPGAPNVNVRTDPFDTASLPAYGPARGSEMRARAVSAVEKSTRFVADAHRESVTKVLERSGRQNFLSEFVLLGLREDYADGFLRKITHDEDLTTGERDVLRQRHMLARAMGLSDVTGVLVPAHLDPMLILAQAGSVNPFRRVCRVETGVTNVYQSVNTGGVTHAWTAENAALTDGAPSFANPTATAYKGTVLVPISYEAYEDARDREDEIMFLVSDSINNAEAIAFATGNGTTQPRGLITALDANTQAEVATATANVFAIADVYALYEAVPARWRNERTSWFSNLSILNDIRQFGTDSLSTQTVDLTADGVTRIIGKAAYESSAMDGVIAAATKDNILAVGDPQTYLIYDRLGTSMEFVPNLMGTTAGTVIGQRAWVAHHRTGANLTVGHAANTTVGFRLLQAST